MERKLSILAPLCACLCLMPLEARGANDAGSQLGPRKAPVPRSVSVGGPAFMRKKLLLDGDGSRCVVSEGDSLPCILDVESFNRRVLTRQMFEGFDTEFVKSRVLLEALEVAFWARKGRETGIHDTASQREDLGAFLRFFERAESQRVLMQKEYPMDFLRYLYERNYQSSFMAARDPVVRLLGSSDLAFIEDVSRRIARFPGGKDLRSPLADLRLHWSRSMVSALPEELASATDTLDVGGRTLVSLPYGHFLLYVDSIAELPEIPFEEAEGALRDIAILEDPDLEYRAHIYWQNNRKEFLEPDTILLAAWLNPDESRSLSMIESPQANLSMKPHSVIPLTGLPVIVLSALPETLTVGTFLGPVATPLGRWWFNALSRKLGGGLKPFRKVCDAVKMKEEILYPPLELFRDLEKDVSIITAQNKAAVAVQLKLQNAEYAVSEGSRSPRLLDLRSEKDRWLRALKVESFPGWAAMLEAKSRNVSTDPLNARDGK